MEQQKRTKTTSQSTLDNMATEVDVLASLSATLQEQDSYEDRVLREASHALAPSLVKTDDDGSLVVSGLPSMESLAPHNPPLEVVYRVLSSTRRQQNDGMTTEIPHLQEQMLLSYLSHKVHDLPIRRNQLEWEEKRSRAYGALETSMQRNMSYPSASSNTSRSKSAVTGVNLGSKRKRRVPMVRRQQIESVEEAEPEIVKDKEELKRLRAERRQRRKERRTKLGLSDGDEGPGESDHEMEFGASSIEIHDDPDHRGNSNERNNQDNVKSEEIAPNADPLDRRSTVCPQCNEVIIAAEQKYLDDELAKHMSQCQTRRRSSRLSGTKAPVEHKDVENILKTRKRKRQTVTAAPKESLDDYEEDQYTDRVDNWIERDWSNMKELKERDTSDLPGAVTHAGGLYIPAWINDRLFGYQREGLEWMWDLHQQQVGGIIGDEMGLGKTVQVCSFLGVLTASRKLRSILIISPATMLQHWLKEMATWAPGIRRILIHTSGETDGTSRTVTPGLLKKLEKWLKQTRSDKLNEAIDEEDWESGEVHSFCGTAYAIVTTYENLRRNADLYAAHRFSYIVLDEAQKIRNPDADVTLACKKVRTPHRLAMSGTPIQNELRELWSLFDFVFPGRLGTLPAFETEFGDPIKRGGYSNASPMQVQLAYRCALTLRDLVNPFLLRRQKKEVKEVSRMPKKTEHVLFCRLTERQRSMYEAYIQSDNVTRLVRGKSNQLLAAVTMLRKICNHPDLVCDPDQASYESFLKIGPGDHPAADDESDGDDDEIKETARSETLMERSGKLEVLSKILPLWNKQGHRVLIFCQWKLMLNIIQTFMMMNEWKFGRLDGNTSVGSRQRLVDDFNNDPSCFALLCTTRTGGVGLNLTGANRIILYDPDFNPSTDAQARERAWRFGQEKEVTIYRLITAGSIEEKIYQRQIFKTALSNKILQDPRQRRLFSQRDIHDLFTLSADSSSMRSGGAGVTDTGKVTKGVGVVDVDHESSERDGTDDPNENGDNDETLRSVMKSKGLAGVFDHHYVEEDPSRKSTTTREMEDHAKRVAKDAVKALERSLHNSDPFTPTWTGSQDTKRFGGASRAGPTGNKGIRLRDPSRSSSDILASIRQKKQEAAVSEESRNSEQYAQLLSKIKRFVAQRRPTTDQILAQFDNIPDCDVAIFKKLLKSVALLRNGRWQLR